MWPSVRAFLRAHPSFPFVAPFQRRPFSAFHERDSVGTSIGSVGHRKVRDRQFGFGLSWLSPGICWEADLKNYNP